MILVMGVYRGVRVGFGGSGDQRCRESLPVRFPGVLRFTGFRGSSSFTGCRLVAVPFG